MVLLLFIVVLYKADGAQRGTLGQNWIPPLPRRIGKFLLLLLLLFQLPLFWLQCHCLAVKKESLNNSPAVESLSTFVALAAILRPVHVTHSFPKLALVWGRIYYWISAMIACHIHCAIYPFPSIDVTLEQWFMELGLVVRAAFRLT